MRSVIVTTLLAFWTLVFGLATGHSFQSYTEDGFDPDTLEDAIIHTPSHKVPRTRGFELTFNIASEEPEFKFHLEPNHDIFVQAPHIRHLDSSGAIRHTETLDGTQHRVFRGSFLARVAGQQWQKKGWARIYLLQDGDSPLFEGAFAVAGQRYRVEVVSEEDPSTKQRMIVHHDGRRSDSVGETCAAGRLSNPGATDPLMDGVDMFTGSTLQDLEKRQFGFNPGDLTESIGSSEGCPTSRRVALVGIATDCSYTAEFNSTESVRRNLINMVNTASEVFESTFNISLGLHNVTISDASCPDGASDSTPWNAECSQGNMDWRLRQFSSWRRSLDDSTNAYWTLMTTCRTGGEVGVSWIGELCNSRMSTNVVARTSNEWQVFAHESAHTFGAVHDCVDSTCSSPSAREQCCPLSSSTCDADAQYLMNPYSSSSHTDFSPCTLGNVCSAIGSGDVRTNCLISNDDVPTITPGECGNGIVEAGEDCDCGDDCDDNSCCNGETCRFRDGAVCDDAAGPCCNDCRFASEDTVCRRSSGACDIEETCPGDSARCPSDRHIPDGESCGNSTGLFCASGECTSRDMQCREQMGSNSTSVSSCNSDSCMLSCSDSTGSCMDTGQQVLDGTPCDGGTCRNGRCGSGSADDGGNGVSSWVDRHRTLVIGLAAGIGGALVLAFLGCIICCCCRRPKVRPSAPPPPRLVPMAYPAPPPYRVAEPRPVLPRYA